MTPVTATTASAATPPPPPTILKTDALGRVQVPAARREALLDEFERSSATAPAFARLAGVNYQTFATWAQTRRRRLARAAAGTEASEPTPAATAVRWLEAVVEASGAGGPAVVTSGAAALHLRLPGGARLEIADAAQVPLAVALLRALEAAGR